MRHLVHISGTEIKHSVFGRFYGGKVSFVTDLEDYSYKLLIGGAKEPMSGDATVFANGDYQVRRIHVSLTEWHDANEEESKHYHDTLRANNMEWRIVTQKFAFGTKDVECLCWIDKDKMPMVVNGTPMTLGEFMKTSFEPDDKIILENDNGYSHLSVDTAKTDAVYNHIERMFTPHVEHKQWANTPFHDGVVIHSNLWGWQYGKKGEWVLRTTKTEIHYSETSNS